MPREDTPLFIDLTAEGIPTSLGVGFKNTPLRMVAPNLLPLGVDRFRSIVLAYDNNIRGNG